MMIFIFVTLNRLMPFSSLFQYSFFPLQDTPCFDLLQLLKLYLHWRVLFDSGLCRAEASRKLSGCFCFFFFILINVSTWRLISFQDALDHLDNIFLVTVGFQFYARLAENARRF